MVQNQQNYANNGRQKKAQHFKNTAHTTCEIACQVGNLAIGYNS